MIKLANKPNPKAISLDPTHLEKSAKNKISKTIIADSSDDAFMENELKKATKPEEEWNDD